jgi:4-hydroxyproline epimerase
MTATIQFVDSHTAGEPTRVIVSGGPSLGSDPLRTRQQLFQRSHDRVRAAVVNEPRGSDVLVGALLEAPCDANCAAGVIFFNNAGYLGMCGHGMMGVVRTLQWLGRIETGEHQIETPVGKVTTTLHADDSISVRNVPSYRLAKAIRLRDVPGVGDVTGDVAWGGNWFFLCSLPDLEMSLGNVDQLTAAAKAIRDAVCQAGFPQVDHIELLSTWRQQPFAPPLEAGTEERQVAGRSRSFVLCPGLAYDRSPCGTGTSAKLACLAADDRLEPGDIWIQQSIVGTEFSATYSWDRTDESSKRIIPTISGSAFVTAHGTLVLDDRDPFCWGIPAPPHDPP